MPESKFAPTIGLEIHTELKTQTKMFCDCLNDPDEKHPNINICPICAGHPGTLPTINKQAVEYVLKVGIALGSRLFPAGTSKFDRKNYFYPDLPKNYQISQYDMPLVEKGELLGVGITRVHLEEDAGRLTHTKDFSLVDLNRAGVPLMELVTEPDIKTAKQAADFARELKLILKYLNVSDADMEKGQLRLEANVSLLPAGSQTLGTKVEIKNINSFKALEEAINYEITRQEKLLISGKKVVQETRGWDDAKKATFSQRGKEEAQDYRYFPEPDLPPLDTASFNLKKIKNEMPELPDHKRARFKKEYGLDEKYLEILIQDPAMAGYFEEAASELGDKKLYAALFHYLSSDLKGLLNKKGIDLEAAGVTPAHLAHLVELAGNGKITSRIAKDLLLEMFETRLDPHQITENKEWQQVTDESHLAEAVREIIAKNPKTVADYKQGRKQALQFLIGQAMAKLKGKADPNTLKKAFEKQL